MKGEKKPIIYFIFIVIEIFCMILFTITFIQRIHFSFICFFSFFIIYWVFFKDFINLDSYNCNMVKPSYIKETYDKVNDIHRDNFYGGRKRKESKNLLMGTFLGISISIFAGAILAIISNSVDVKIYSIILENNQTLNLSQPEIALNTIKQAGVYLNYIYLAAIALLSFLISYLLFTLHIMNNVSLLESRHIIKYKILKENYSTFELANKFKEDLEKEIKLRIKKNKWWRLKLINENDKFKIMIYHKIKRWISEKVNFVLIDDDFISIIYSSSMHGEGIAKICYDYVLYLERKKIIERKR